MGDVNQDDIDKMLQGLGGDEPDSPPAAPTPPEEERGAASQDDIDALFAAAESGEMAAASAPAPAAAPEPAPAEPEPAPAAPEEYMDGVANQDDIDALFAAVGGNDAVQELDVPEASEELSGVASQDDIDELLSAVIPGDTPPESEPEAEADEDDSEPADAAPEDLDEFLNTDEPVTDTADREVDTAELDQIMSSIAVTNPADEGEEEPGELGDTMQVDDVDMEELLKQVAEAAPPPPPPKPQRQPEGDQGNTIVLDMTETTRQLGEVAAPPPQPAPAAPVPPPAAQATAQLPPMPELPPAPEPSGRQEYSVLHGAGEVEALANQVGGLVATLSEKAHRYMQAWIAADGEARELRTRALQEERRRTSLTSEREVLSRELDELRQRIGELEGGKLAWEEARRTLETSFQAKIREMESQVKLLSAEAETLKDELTRARNQATGVDIESRRARFEVDRLKNEAESERMERLRIQRALENQEKEIQAMQAQASGQASSLFIDELHRLVRRLESELEARSSGAHEALKQLDRLEAPEAMVPVVANLRAALMQAIGADENPDDALKSLGREASGVKGPAALAPGKSEVLSFETAVSTYNLTGAIDIAGALLREAKATPALLMRKVYQCPAMRRPEVAEHLSNLATLLEGLRTVQESSDRARGKESGESEVFYVQMFDYLHNLVRLKLVNRMSGDMWRLFLDLRGRFSFVTSDKQWAEYRDKTLNDKPL